MRQPPRRPRLVPTWLSVALVYFACYGVLLPPQFMPQVWAATPAPAGGDDHAASLRESVRATQAATQLATSIYDNYAAMGMHPTTLWKQLAAQPEFRHRATQPDALLNWVTTQTRWLPYRGAVRGAYGVVLDRQGNHADRALLLWELLRLSGQPARLAHGTLAPAVAADLVPRAADQRRKQRAAVAQAAGQAADRADGTVFAEEIDRAARAAGLDDPAFARRAAGLLTDAQSLRETMAATRALQSAALSEALDRADAIPAAPAAPDQADPADAMSDHWWVQIADGEQWRDLDPLRSLGEGTAYQTPDAAATFASPKEMAAADDTFQSVTIRVVAESARGADLSRTSLVESVVYPAELTSETLTLSIESIGLDARVNLALADLPAEEAWAQAREALLEQQLWVPVMLVNGTEIHADGVDAAGRIVKDPPVGRTAGTAIKSKLGDAIGALGNAGDAWDPDGPDQLHGLAIEFVTQVPGRPVEIERRVIYDALDGRAPATDRPRTPQDWWANAPDRAATAAAQTTSFDDQARLQRAMRLQWSSQIALLNCQMPAALLAAKQAQAIKASRTAMLKALAADSRARQAGSGPSETLEALSETQGSDAPLWTFAVLRHTTDVADDAKLFYDRPNVVALHATAGVRPDGRPTVTFGFDIVTAGTGVDAEGFGARFRARVAQGAADAAAEGALSDLFDTDRTTKRFVGGPTTAAGRLEADTAANQPWTAVPAASGRTVFAAAAAGAPAAPHYVIRADGTTIGIDVHGWGGITAEYLIVLGLGMFISSMVIMVICVLAASLVGAVAGAVDSALQDAGVSWAVPGEIADDPQGWCVSSGLCGMAIGLAVAFGAAAYASAAGISVSGAAVPTTAMKVQAFLAGLVAKVPCTAIFD